MRRDVRYHSLHPRNTLDWYEPDDPCGLLVFLHGGAWISGDKREWTNVGLGFAERRLSVAIPNYRLSSESGVSHPDHLADVAASLAFLQSESSLPILVAGHSAGAWMAAMLATTEFRPAVRGYVGLEGIYDLPDLVGTWPTYRDWFIEKAFGSEEGWAEASPTRRSLVHSAPWLVIHARGDELVDAGQSASWKEKLVGERVRAEVFDPGELRHDEVVERIGQPGDATTLAIADFADRLFSAS